MYALEIPFEMLYEQTTRITKALLILCLLLLAG